MNWALDDPERFIRERKELEALCAYEWFTAFTLKVSKQLDIFFDIDLLIHDIKYEIRLFYPYHFPDTPPYIRPRDKAAHWSRHQFQAGGSLCLEWRSDNWETHVCGAQLIQSAYKLLATERDPKAPKTVISADIQTEGQILRSTFARALLTPALVKKLNEISDGTVLHIVTRTFLHLESFITLVSKIGVTNSSLTEIDDLPSGVTSSNSVLCSSMNGLIFRSTSFDDFSGEISIEILLSLISRAGFENCHELLFDENEKLNNHMLILLGSSISKIRFFEITSSSQSINEAKIIFSSAMKMRNPAESDKLTSKKICIVGLGSVGTKVTISLARSGVKNFYLIDDDILKPENVCRNDLLWSSVGRHKVDAVKEMLSLVAPNIEVTTEIHRISGQGSPLLAAGVLKNIGECDLVIDATANSDVFLVLAAIARKQIIPICWGEVFAGGIGGLIARSRPNLDPNPLAVRNSILGFFSEFSEAPFKEVLNYDGMEQDPLIAFDSDVGHIASSLTRLAIDTIGLSETRIFPYSAYFIGMKACPDWIIEQPFDTRPIEVSGEGWLISENTGQSDSQKKVALELLSALKNN